jgi:hypothetical protein
MRRRPSKDGLRTEPASLLRGSPCGLAPQDDVGEVALLRGDARELLLRRGRRRPRAAVARAAVAQPIDVKIDRRHGVEGEDLGQALVHLQPAVKVWNRYCI